MCMHACMHACDTCMHGKSKGLREEGRRMWRVAGSGAPTVGLPRRRCRRNGLVDGGWPRQAGALGLLRLVAGMAAGLHRFVTASIYDCLCPWLPLSTSASIYDCLYLCLPRCHCQPMNASRGFRSKRLGRGRGGGGGCERQSSAGGGGRCALCVCLTCLPYMSVPSPPTPGRH